MIKSEYKTNVKKFDEIAEAIAGGDIKSAHRMAHSLKTNAALIGKTDLQNAAANVERLLAGGKNETVRKDMDFLKMELTAVLNEITAFVGETKISNTSFNKEQVLRLLNTLEPMLRDANPECRYLLDEIHTIPGAELLAEQVDDFDFKSAAATLSGLKEKMGVKSWMQ